MMMTILMEKDSPSIVSKDKPSVISYNRFGKEFNTRLIISQNFFIAKNFTDCTVAL